MIKVFTQSHFRLKTTATLRLMFLFTSLLFFSSCAPEPADELNKKIKIALRSDKAIDETEWNELTGYIIEHSEEFEHLVGKDNKVNSEMLVALISSIANKRRGTTEPEIFQPVNSVVKEKAKINVFIENSGSMDGYVRGITDFEIAIGKILVLSKYYNAGGLKVNFINKNIYPAPEITELTTFAKALEPKKGSPYYDNGGNKNRSESILNNVIKLILDSIKDNSISILVSDCIYSLDNTSDTKGSLGYQQNGTMGAFLNAFRMNPSTDLVTSIYKMNSNYTGKYYPYNYKRSLNNHIAIKNENRPYYIWIIGDRSVVNPILKKLSIENLKGYEQSYFLSNSIKTKQPFYTILQETNNSLGKFRPIKKGKSEITSICKLEFENKKLKFAIAIDLSEVIAEESYKRDTSNYKVPNGFSVLSIDKIDISNMPKNDFTKISGTLATHFITIEMNQDYPVQDLKLELLNSIPKWVAASNSMDDTDVKNQLNKTFGLQYLIGGVSEAYKNKSYISINITIKN